MHSTSSLQTGYSEVALIVGALDAPSFLPMILRREMPIKAPYAEVDDLRFVGGCGVDLRGEEHFPIA